MTINRSERISRDKARRIVSMNFAMFDEGRDEIPPGIRVYVRVAALLRYKCAFCWLTVHDRVMHHIIANLRGR